MSRIPRSQEHLKTSFAAEAQTAARYRAFAAQAEREGLPNLAARWVALAEEKDRLAVQQLEAAGQVQADEKNLASALAEERYENEVLYPRMAEDVDADTAEALLSVVESQQNTVSALESLQGALKTSTGDIAAE